MYLDELPIESHTVSLGKPGLHGKLGWKGLHVRVGGIKYDRSIGAHAPSSLVYDIGGRYDLFTCRLALNDSSFGHDIHPTATFQVLADGVVAAAVSNVHTSKPRSLIANIQGAQRLELRVICPAMAYCHSVWLDPKVDVWPKEGLLDPIGQVRIHRPKKPIVADRCIVTMVSPGYSRWLDIFLNSLKANGGCGDAAVVVFSVDADCHCSAVIAAHGARTVRCTSLVPRSSTIRPAVFSVGAAASYKSAIVAECDMIVLQDISALWPAIDVCADPILLVAREQHRDVPYRLDEFFPTVFLGSPAELDRFGATERERAYDLQINGGIIAGTAEAVALLESTMRGLLPYSRRWVQSRRDVPGREMFVINLAMARLNNAMRIKPSYNAQTFNGNEKLLSFSPNPQGAQGADPPVFEANGAQVKVLHFSTRKESYAGVQFNYWQCGNHIRKLSDGLDEIRRAPLKMLRSVDFVAGIIRKIGLGEMPEAEFLYGDDLACMNSGAGLLQIPMQLARALIWLGGKKIRSYAEVGVLHGWTFSFITAYLHRFGSLKRSAAIDIGRWFDAYEYVSELYPIEFHRGTSALLEGAAFDLVFIDGDHSYGASQQDWLRVGRNARYCMFHDINDARVERFSRVDTIKKLWAELRARSEYSYLEFLDHSSAAPAMGIGLLCLEKSE